MEIRFLKPLNILPFTGNDIYKDLEIVIDNKLQIELIPFGSDNFNYNEVGIKNIEPFIDNILSLIAAKERKQQRQQRYSSKSIQPQIQLSSQSIRKKVTVLNLVLQTSINCCDGNVDVHVPVQGRDKVHT